MNIIRLSRKTTVIVIVVLMLLFAYHMFDIFVMRDHINEMARYSTEKSTIHYITISYDRDNAERANFHGVNNINQVNEIIKYSNEFTRNKWKHYNKPARDVPFNFIPNFNEDYSEDGLVASCTVNSDTYLITKLKLGPSNENFTYTLKDLDGLFEDSEELEICNLCTFKPDDVSGLQSLSSLKKIYLNGNKTGDLPVAKEIKRQLPELKVYYGPRHEEVTLEMAND